MAQTSSPSFPSKDASISSVPSPAVAVPDAKTARDAQGYYPQAFKVAAVPYAASCGKSQRAAAKDLGLSDGTLGDWTRDAQPDSAGIVDAARFDELAQLRTQVALCFGSDAGSDLQPPPAPIRPPPSYPPRAS